MTKSQAKESALQNLGHVIARIASGTFDATDARGVAMVLDALAADLREAHGIVGDRLPPRLHHAHAAPSPEEVRRHQYDEDSGQAADDREGRDPS